MDQDRIENMLWKYIDNTCTSKEKAEIESLLLNNKEAAHLYNQLQQINSSLNTQLISHAPESLTEDILAKVNHKTTINPASFRIVPLILFSLLLLSMTALTLPSSQVYALPEIDWSFLHNALAIPETYSAYIMGMVAAVSLIWCDYFLSRKILFNK